MPRQHGAGRNYLIQHSAGSGKSNSIAWLAHRLATPARRRRREGVPLGHRHHRPARARSAVAGHDLPVRAQDRAWSRRSTRTPSSSHARCRSGTPIIITTHPEVSLHHAGALHPGEEGPGVKIDTAGKRFAVIVDEAHSSQSGETATALKGMLNKEGIEAAIAAQMSDEEDDDLSDEARASDPAGCAEARASAEPQLLRLHRDPEVQDQGRCSTSRDRPAHRRSTSTPCGRPSRRASSWTCSRTTRPTSASSASSSRSRRSRGAAARRPPRRWRGISSCTRSTSSRSSRSSSSTSASTSCTRWAGARRRWSSPARGSPPSSTSSPSTATSRTTATPASAPWSPSPARSRTRTTPARPTPKSR